MGSLPQTPKLFQPIKVGRMNLQHRVVMAPLTRFRADSNHVHTDLAVEYYRQRASTPGTLLITEATFITPRAGGYTHVPGIYSKEQIAAWKRITEAVHAKGSYIFMQLWALGRAADGSVLRQEGNYDVVSASNIPIDQGNHATPRPLTLEEIQSYVQDYRQAGSNAIEAGFDGVEIHNANGYLLDQFLQDVSNDRTDQYGGSIENRARFPLQVANALAETIGADRVAVRLSPWSKFQTMGMKDPEPQFTYFISQLPRDLAYVHAVESRILGNNEDPTSEYHSLDALQDAWGQDKVFMRAGGFKPKTAVSVSEQPRNVNGLIAIGRYFISNPDLPRRIKLGVELEPYNRDLFYNKTEARGYVDYTDSTPIESAAKF